MSYLDESRLSTYDSSLKEWISSQESKTITSSIYPWTKTAKASTVSCYPVGGTELKPVVDFLFTETPPASGDKSPSNPSSITGVESVKIWRCGDNILPGNRKDNYAGETGTFSTDADGYVSYSAMSDGRAFVYSLCNAQVYLHAGQQYVLHTEVKTAATSMNRTMKILDEDNTSVLAVSPGVSDNSHTFTPPHDGMYGVIYKIYDGIYRFSLYLGSTAASFEPYSSADYTLPLGSTYYGGNIDLATGVMTVTWGSLTFTSVNNFQGDNGTCVKFAHVSTTRIDTHYTGSYSDFFACSMFPVLSFSPQNVEFCRAIGSGGSGSQSAVFSILKTRLDVSGAVDPSSPTNAEWLAAINAWLAEHPVTYYFKLYYPYTVQLTPTEILSLPQTDKYTPRLNTVYTDASSVQVGYVKSPIREEYELTQAIVAQGGNV